MEYLETDSKTWKTHTNSSITQSFKPTSLHPSSCCLCAISSVVSEEELLDQTFLNETAPSDQSGEIEVGGDADQTILNAVEDTVIPFRGREHAGPLLRLSNGVDGINSDRFSVTLDQVEASDASIDALKLSEGDIVLQEYDLHNTSNDPPSTFFNLNKTIKFDSSRNNTSSVCSRQEDSTIPGSDGGTYSETVRDSDEGSLQTDEILYKKEKTLASLYCDDEQENCDGPTDKVQYLPEGETSQAEVKDFSDNDYQEIDFIDKDEIFSSSSIRQGTSEESDMSVNDQSEAGRIPERNKTNTSCVSEKVETRNVPPEVDKAQENMCETRGDDRNWSEGNDFPEDYEVRRSDSLEEYKTDASAAFINNAIECDLLSEEKTRHLNISENEIQRNTSTELDDGSSVQVLLTNIQESNSFAINETQDDLSERKNKTAGLQPTENCFLESVLPEKDEIVENDFTEICDIYCTNDENSCSIDEVDLKFNSNLFAQDRIEANDLLGQNEVQNCSAEEQIIHTSDFTEQDETPTMDLNEQDETLSCDLVECGRLQRHNLAGHSETQSTYFTEQSETQTYNTDTTNEIEIVDLAEHNEVLSSEVADQKKTPTYVMNDHFETQEESKTCDLPEKDDGFNWIDQDGTQAVDLVDQKEIKASGFFVRDELQMSDSVVEDETFTNNLCTQRTTQTADIAGKDKIQASYIYDQEETEATDLTDQDEVQDSYLSNQKETQASNFADQVKLNDLVERIETNITSDLASKMETEAAALTDEDESKASDFTDQDQTRATELTNQVDTRVIDFALPEITESKDLSEQNEADVHYINSSKKTEASDLTDMNKTKANDLADQKETEASDLTDLNKTKASDLADQKETEASDLTDLNKTKASDLADPDETEASDLTDLNKPKASDLADPDETEVSDLTDMNKTKASDLDDQKETEVSDSTDLNKQKASDLADSKETESSNDVAVADSITIETGYLCDLKEPESNDLAESDEAISSDVDDLKETEDDDLTGPRETESSKEVEPKETEDTDVANLGEIEAIDLADLKGTEASDLTDSEETESSEAADSKEAESSDVADSMETEISDLAGPRETESNDIANLKEIETRNFSDLKQIASDFPDTQKTEASDLTDQKEIKAANFVDEMQTEASDLTDQKTTDASESTDLAHLKETETNNLSDQKATEVCDLADPMETTASDLRDLKETEISDITKQHATQTHEFADEDEPDTSDLSGLNRTRTSILADDCYTPAKNTLHRYQEEIQIIHSAIRDRAMASDFPVNCEAIASVENCESGDSQSSCKEFNQWQTNTVSGADVAENARVTDINKFSEQEYEENFEDHHTDQIDGGSLLTIDSVYIEHNKQHSSRIVDKETCYTREGKDTEEPVKEIPESVSEGGGDFTIDIDSSINSFSSELLVSNGTLTPEKGYSLEDGEEVREETSDYSSEGESSSCLDVSGMGELYADNMFVVTDRSVRNPNIQEEDLACSMECLQTPAVGNIGGIISKQDTYIDDVDSLRNFQTYSPCSGYSITSDNDGYAVDKNADLFNASISYSVPPVLPSLSNISFTDSGSQVCDDCPVTLCQSDCGIDESKAGSTFFDKIKINASDNKLSQNRLEEACGETRRNVSENEQSVDIISGDHCLSVDVLPGTDEKLINVSILSEQKISFLASEYNSALSENNTVKQSNIQTSNLSELVEKIYEEDGESLKDGVAAVPSTNSKCSSVFHSHTVNDKTSSELAASHLEVLSKDFERNMDGKICEGDKNVFVDNIKDDDCKCEKDKDANGCCALCVKDECILNHASELKLKSDNIHRKSSNSCSRDSVTEFSVDKKPVEDKETIDGDCSDLLNGNGDTFVTCACDVTRDLSGDRRTVSELFENGSEIADNVYESETLNGLSTVALSVRKENVSIVSEVACVGIVDFQGTNNLLHVDQSVDIFSGLTEKRSESPLATITEEREDLSLNFSEVCSVPLTECKFKKSAEFEYNGTDDNRSVEENDGCSEKVYTVEGNCSSGLQLVVGSVVRDIPDIYLFMQTAEGEEEEGEVEASSSCYQSENENDNNEYLSESESEASFQEPAEAIVMMNDDESFITVVPPIGEEDEGERTLYAEDTEAEPTYDANILVSSNEILSAESEPAVKNKFPNLHDSAFKRKLSQFERRLSSISLNKFRLKIPSGEIKEDPPSEDLPKPRRPLSGVKKKLASSRRRKSEVPSNQSHILEDPESDSEVFPTDFVSSRDFKGLRRPSTVAERINLPKKGKKEGYEKRRSISGHENEVFSFGKRSQGGGRRPNECLILEPSEMMVIDYPDVQLLHAGQRPTVNHRAIDKLHLALDHRELPLRGAGGAGCPLNSSSVPLADGAPPHFHTHPHLQQLHHELPDLLRGGRSRGSVGSSVRDGSDTSSAYSGSDTMCQSIHSLDHEDVDLSGLMESVVDSDEEDLVENVECLSVQDTVRDCLEKDPSDRSDSDIKVLLEFTERLPAFANMTVGVRRAMCQAMVFAVVEEADTVLMNDGEELDSWSVIINGQVEVTHSDGSLERLHLGDSFGITPTMEKMYHRGVMRSKVDDCQFVCIRQSDYYRILRQGEENTRRLEEGGVTVLVTEKSHIDACQREANIVIKGTPERLMLHLVEVENILDPTYVEDFLLMHRKFINGPVLVMKKLLEWFEDPKYQDIVTRVILRWVQSHFTDFEMDPEMMSYLEQFEEGLQRKEMTGQLLFLRVVCMTKARSRVVTLTRPSRDKPLQFTIQGGKSYGIFISHVEKGSKAEEAGLKRADQILEANGQSFENISKAKAVEILTCTCHLAITVRSNLHAYNDMLHNPESSHKPKSRKAELGGNGTCPGSLDFASTLNLNTALSPQLIHSRKEGKGISMTLRTQKFKEFLSSIVTKSSIIDTPVCSDDSVSSHSSTGGHLYRSRSNPDLSSTDYEENSRSEFPEHVLKVYRATDQSTRFLPVHKETTAREVVMLSLRLFAMTEPSKNYALYEVSVTEQGVVKQKKLPDTLQNLAERIGLNSRYYLKGVTSTQPLCPDEVVAELVKESQVSILQLNSVVELAIQLTLENFAIFRQIEPTEYVDDLFKLKSKYGTSALSRFEEISNKELYWVCTEVCNERNIYKRAKIIKQFIKISKYCKDLNNFNSMFAVLSGLGSTPVRRLRQTWSKVPNRYVKIFQDLENIMNPSQNMKNYRTLASSASSQSPMIPFYPIVKKDLLFLNEGNDDEVDGLINFEKLRTISKSIRKLGEMCSAKYYPNKMLERLGQPLSTAMTAMNQGITGGQQSSTVKRRKKSTAQPDKKKMFEEAQTVRRVKAYLSQLNVIKDEDVLLKMSFECEPPASTHSGGGTSGASHTVIGSSSSSSSSSGQQSTGGSNSAPPSNPQTRRRHHSPTPSTASSNSSTSHTSEGKKTHTRFGAASPSSERKMLSLAEATKKPYHGPRPPTTTTTLSQTSHSPNPSPGVLRRGPAPPIPVTAPCPPTSRGNHERSHSDTPVTSVDLNAESSSVTSLSSLANLRKSLTSGSVASNECHGSQGETDSGISTHFDCHSSSSLEVGGGGVAYDGHYPPSPPSHHRRFSHQSEACFKPPFPHAVPVLPPVPPEVCGGRILRRGVNGGPPDYTSTQMRIQQLGRALSHDGVPYYHHTRHEAEDEDEAQVSAV